MSVFFRSVGIDVHSLLCPIVEIPVLLCKFSTSCWNDSLLLLGFKAVCMPTKDSLKSLYRIVSPLLFCMIYVFPHVLKDIFFGEDGKSLRPP